MARIYYIGDWAVLLGPRFAESPFQSSLKGLDIFNYGKWLKAALESTGRHEVVSAPSWDFYKLGPGDYEKILDSHEVVVFSDVEGKLFQLAPSFFDREKFGGKPLVFPDRLRLTQEFVERGKGLMVLGGWYSYTGELGKGGWGRTRLREILPVKCLDYDDLIENTEGFTPEPTAAGVKHFGDIDWESCPPILGYNQVRQIPEGEILLHVKETGDPLLAIRRVGMGRVLAYTSDPAPHWGCNFVYWKHYNRFWLRCLDLILPQ